MRIGWPSPPGLFVVQILGDQTPGVLGWNLWIKGLRGRSPGMFEWSGDVLGEFEVALGVWSGLGLEGTGRSCLS